MRPLHAWSSGHPLSQLVPVRRPTQFDANGNVQCSCVCSDCFSGDRCEIPWDLDNKCKECVDNVVRPTSAAESCGENCGTCNAATGHCDCMPDFFGEFCSEYDACTGYNCGSHGRCNAFVLPPAVQSACPMQPAVASPHGFPASDSDVRCAFVATISPSPRWKETKYRITARETRISW